LRYSNKKRIKNNKNNKNREKTKLVDNQENLSQKKKKTIIVISGDGGGMKGIIPLTILSEIAKRTKHHASDYAYLFVGCSTSTIGTSGLIVPDDKDKDKPAFSENNVRGFYFQDGPIIFPSNQFNWTENQKRFILDDDLKPTKNSLFHFLLKGSVYDDRNLSAVLRKRFGNMKAKECIKPFIFPTTDFKKGETIWLTNSYELSKANEDAYYVPEMKMADIIEACVRPNFFFKYREMEIEYQTLDDNGDTKNHTKTIIPTDGSYFAGSPEAYAYHYAKTLLAAEGYEEDEYRLVVLSLGTGQQAISHTTAELNGEVGFWKRTFKGLAQFNALATSADLALTLQFRARAAELRTSMWRNGDLLFKFDAPIDKENPNHPDQSFTNASRKNLNKLVDFAHKDVIEANQEELDTFIEVIERSMRGEGIEDIAKKRLKKNYKPLRKPRTESRWSSIKSFFGHSASNDNNTQKSPVKKKKDPRPA